METDAPPVESSLKSKSARTSSRTPPRGPRVELITRGEPRRRWSTEQKQAIAAKSFAPGVSSMDVAREFGISSGLISTWRKALLAAQPAESVGSLTRFARVELAGNPRQAEPASGPPVLPGPQPRPASLIEIVLPDGTTVRVDAQIDPRALRRVLTTLRG
jgi:transposase